MGEPHTAAFSALRAPGVIVLSLPFRVLPQVLLEEEHVGLVLGAGHVVRTINVGISGRITVS